MNRTVLFPFIYIWLFLTIFLSREMSSSIHSRFLEKRCEIRWKKIPWKEMRIYIHLKYVLVCLKLCIIYEQSGTIEHLHRCTVSKRGEMRELARRELQRPREISLHRRISIVCRGLVLRTTRARYTTRVGWLLNDTGCWYIYVSHAAFVDPRELIQLAIQAVPCPRFLRTFLWTRRRSMLQLTYNRSCLSFWSLIGNNALEEENAY